MSDDQKQYYCVQCGAQWLHKGEVEIRLASEGVSNKSKIKNGMYPSVCWFCAYPDDQPLAISLSNV